MQAIILAGGFGTRLQSVVSDVPKPMAPINGKPFLEYLLDELYCQGFNKVVLAVGYKKEIIKNHFGNNYKNIEIVYSVEDEPLGTGGCVKKAMELIDDDYVFVLNGDTMFKIDFNKMTRTNSLSIACKKMSKFERYGNVIIDDSIIKSFEEKKYVDEGYINGGIYYLPKDFFKKYTLPMKFSMEKDVFEKYVDELEINAYISNDYFIDIGIPEDYNKAQEDFSKMKALFLDRDGIINVDYGHVHKKKNFVICSDILDVCKWFKERDFKIFVITNQAGVSKKIYKEKEIHKLHKYMINFFKKNSIEIEKIYYCPHSSTDNCNCRKPKPGMFLKAIKEFNIDPNQSVAIGDKMSDLEAAHEAGIKKIIFKFTRYEEYPVAFDYEKYEELFYYNQKKNLYHIKLNDFNLEYVVSSVKHAVDNKTKQSIVPVNLDMLRLSYYDSEFRNIINKSDISVIDGKPLIWLSKILKNGLKFKLSGSDLIYPVLELANKNSYSILIFGGRSEVGLLAKKNIEREYSNIKVFAHSPEFGFEKSKEGNLKAVDVINKINADIVLLCLSAPKQEKFFYRNKDLLNNSCYLCAGATVDFLAKTISRAPKLMSKIGLEWLFRLFHEPKRLFKRYVLDFIFLIKILFVGFFRKKKIVVMREELYNEKNCD